MLVTDLAGGISIGVEEEEEEEVKEDHHFAPEFITRPAGQTIDEGESVSTHQHVCLLVPAYLPVTCTLIIVYCLIGQF